MSIKPPETRSNVSIKPPETRSSVSIKPPEPPPVRRAALVTAAALGPKEANIERGKSFLEARSAVQRQIEKMFVDSQDKDDVPRGQGVKHVSHGVSHVMMMIIIMMIMMMMIIMMMTMMMMMIVSDLVYILKMIPQVP